MRRGRNAAPGWQLLARRVAEVPRWDPMLSEAAGGQERHPWVADRWPQCSLRASLPGLSHGHFPWVLCGH